MISGTLKHEKGFVFRHFLLHLSNGLQLCVILNVCMVISGILIWPTWISIVSQASAVARFCPGSGLTCQVASPERAPVPASSWILTRDFGLSEELIILMQHLLNARSSFTFSSRTLFTSIAAPRALHSRQGSPVSNQSFTSSVRTTLCGQQSQRASRSP